MHFQWLTTEHNRLHIVEEWPDSPLKEAALAAIRSTLAGLMRNTPRDMSLPQCEVCMSRKHASGLVQFPADRPRAGSVCTILAA
ncbi:MAG: hypothetical protein LAP38_00990 [Acidobacteriia bacterium]|nr:hypothetical protein [Terriglobia bacterium]